MRMYDIIHKKRDGYELSEEEIKFIIDGYVKEEIPDYQMSALLMAIYFNSMTDREIGILTKEVAHSGDMVDLSAIEGIKVDKHSTGGVGDKTSLIIAPLVASLGVKVAKMSGRGLGHTGGTVDKMESIPGMKTSLESQEFIDIVNDIGVSLIGQTGNLAPADKKLYALRDVTATVDSIPLIAASIMSKKLAAGSDAILLDVKTGSGAFMKTIEDSIKLAQTMVAIGQHAGKNTMALITDMDIPLGNMIGISLEIKEVIDTLQGRGPEDLTEVSIELAANMLYLAEKAEIEECRKMARGAIDNGSAFDKFVELVKAQGGDLKVILNPEKFDQAKYEMEVRALKSGHISHIDTEKCGIASTILGAGRMKKEDDIDYAAGIELVKKIGDRVEEGDVLVKLYTNDEKLFENSSKLIEEAYVINDEKIVLSPLVLARVTKDSVERFY